MLAQSHFKDCLQQSKSFAKILKDSSTKVIAAKTSFTQQRKSCQDSLAKSKSKTLLIVQLS